ncbi:hypothetical protein HFD88_006304 [Aspergillus terreus]|nr:hypothetical protein HFD88_006304 [Aspergillus terreus]
MVSDDDASSPRKRRRIGNPKASPYLLRPLFDQIPLTADDPNAEVHITCVEYWNDNLYIGTSAAEILHFVSLPPDPADNTSDSTFILASRLPITFSHGASTSSQLPGIQQIILLPSVNKACILCNGTVTFYMLPELSPAFDNTKVGNCRWIGGLDQNTEPDEPENPVIMIGAQNRIMLVRIGDAARRVRNIEFPSCLAAARRGIIACAADAHGYSLLDVEHQQKIPLFPVSVLNEAIGSGQIEDMPPASSPSLSTPSPPAADRSHNRSSSLNTLAGMLQPNPQSSARDRSSSVTPELSSESGTPRRSLSQERGRSASPRTSTEHPEEESQSSTGEAAKPLPPLPKQPSAQLKPHVLSPTPNEFLVVRGTDETEPGVGLFVNMDGDVDRGTITFHRYPKSIVIDKGDENNLMQSPEDTREQLVLAVIETEKDGKPFKSLEVQPWDVDPAEAEDHKNWVDFPSTTGDSSHVGLCHTTSPSKLEIYEMGKLLRMVRLKTPLLSPHIPATDSRTQASIEQLQKEKELFEAQEATDSESSRKEDTAGRGWEAERNAEEAKFARDLGKTQSSLLMWSGNQIWRIVRNPLPIQLNDTLRTAQDLDNGRHKVLKRKVIEDTIELIQSTEPKSEAEFLGLNYLKQKASLLLLGDLMSMDPASRTPAVIDGTERALISGNLDPRIALLLVPSLRQEVLQGPQGIWIHAGLAEVAEVYINQSESPRAGAFDGNVLDMVKRFLISWQQKRGYGSITDETYVFDSVDAALLRLLLEQDSSVTVDQRSPVRAELNRLVDNWKGNFERAVVLLEGHRRLYVLSRLYQSRKMSGNVLKTWRRIIEGEEDVGREVSAPGVEMQMRKYLVKIKDAQLVEEYGAWLAQRNPSLGIQVFADSASRVRLEPTDVVPLLKERAPNAVQEYLEHLVFSKNYTQYADDLLSYYLDTVLSVLESSPEARASLAESYSTYRALRPPKPTYMNFITENTPSEPWWQSRLRLLQLLGGGSGSQFSSLPSTSFSYSIPAVLARIEPFQNELVSESVILDGLQGRHREALRLLTHGLGDYDSAVRYCILGGPRSTSATGSLTEFADRPLQTELFGYLLDEFLRIEDLSERIERTSDLLARFASFFDVGEVLRLVPDDWSVDILSGFLAHVFRVLVAQGRETRIERALSAGLNLRVGTEYIEGVEKVGGWVEDDDGLRRLRGGNAGDGDRRALVTDDSDFGEMIGPRSD